VLLSYHYEEHFELCHCRDRVGLVGGHYGDFALFQIERFAVYGDFGFAFYDIE
jgi:hypothetical protein